MATTQDDIRGWWKNRPELTTHMIVVCDTFDYEDYPVYVARGQDVSVELEKYTTNMQRVVEENSAALDFEGQLAEHRAYHLDVAAPPERA